MGWALEIVLPEFEEELKRYGIKIDSRNEVIVTKDTATRLIPTNSTDKYRKIIREIIAAAEAERKAKIQAKQLPLL